MDIVEGKPTGSVRISFGYMSTKKDAEVFIQFIKDCFVKKLCDQEKLEHCETPAGENVGSLSLPADTCSQAM